MFSPRAFRPLAFWSFSCVWSFIFGFWAWPGAASAAAPEPAKLAATARFDLSAEAGVGALNDGRLIAGDGSVARKNWVKGVERPLGYTVNFRVSHRGWSVAAVRFTPEHAGAVHLALMGPWEEAKPGTLYRQEVLWDAVQIEGAALDDGGFESAAASPNGGASRAWHGVGRIVEQTADVPAVEGTHYARTWHNQTLSTTFQVDARRPVIIRLSARAVRPAGYREMARIRGHDTPAHRAARRFRHGANLGNGLEVPPGQDWGVHYTPEDLAHIRAEGFDHVRIPIGWHHYTGPAPEFKIRPEIYQRADELVNAGLRQGLGVIVNIHHFDEFTTNPQRETPRFLAIWDQIARHYAQAPPALAFELLNEPKDAATTDVINPIFERAIQTVRAVAPKRTIFVGPGRWNSVSELGQLRLPEDDTNLIVTVHNYGPFYFTHQGATWAGPDTKLTGIRFPGPPERPLKPPAGLKLGPNVLEWLRRYNEAPADSNPCGPGAFAGAIAQAREWSEYYGRPVHFGEFGSFTTADPQSRANYYRAFRSAAEEAGVGWAIWDWKAGFRYWNEKTQSPEPGMRAALFGKGTPAPVRPSR